MAKQAPVTGQTITDEQIRGLQEETWEAWAQTCRALGYSAHGDGYVSFDERATGRARCAEMFNARNAKATT